MTTYNVLFIIFMQIAIEACGSILLHNDKADVLEPNDAFTLKLRGDVKRKLDDYQGALEDLDKADVLEPNDAFTLNVRGAVKRKLDDYQGALDCVKVFSEFQPL